MVAEEGAVVVAEGDVAGDVAEDAAGVFDDSERLRGAAVGEGAHEEGERALHLADGGLVGAAVRAEVPQRREDRLEGGLFVRPPRAAPPWTPRPRASSGCAARWPSPGAGPRRPPPPPSPPPPAAPPAPPGSRRTSTAAPCWSRRRTSGSSAPSPRTCTIPSLGSFVPSRKAGVKTNRVTPKWCNLIPK